MPDAVRSLPWRRRLSVGYRKVANRFLIEDVNGQRDGRWAPILYRIPVIIPVLVLVTAAAAWTVFVLLARISGFEVTWWAPGVGSVPADKRGDLVRDTLAVLALFGALLAGVYAYRKQRLEEAAGYRADAAARASAQKDFSGRYQDAAVQLGHEKAAVRLAGVYAMARLADDWPEQRQPCIDVLCAYLRMPWEQGAEESRDREVRQAILAVMAEHLRPEEGGSWCNLRFDLRGARLPDFSLDFLQFSKPPRLAGCQFEGTHSLGHVVFVGGGDLKDIVVEGTASVRIGQVSISADCLSLVRAKVFGSLSIETSMISPNAVLDFTSMEVRGTLDVRVTSGNDPQGRIVADAVSVSTGARIAVNRISDDGGTQPGLRLERWRRTGTEEPTVSVPADVDRGKLWR